MRFLKVKVFSILVDRVCKVKYDSLKVCSKMFRHFAGGSSFLRVLNASTIRIQICSFPICDFASSQQFHQIHNSPVFVSFRSISLIFLAINSTVIAAVSSFGVNCSSRLKMLSECICLKECAIVASVRTAWRASVL